VQQPGRDVYRSSNGRRAVFNRSCNHRVTGRLLRQGDLVLSCLRQFVVDRRQVAAAIRQMSTHVRLNAARVQHRSTETAGSAADQDDEHRGVLDCVLAAASTPTTVHRMCSVGLTHAHLTTLPLEFLSAGSETSSATLIWILRFMVMHPDVQVVLMSLAMRDRFRNNNNVIF